MTEPATALLRTVFLVDGFNLYQSLARASADLGPQTEDELQLA